MGKINGREIIIVFFMVAAAYGYFSPRSEWNANSRLSLVKAIVEHHRFEIESYTETTLPTEDKASFEGHFYSDKAIGASLLGAGFYRIIYTIYPDFGLKRNTHLFVELITFLAISLISAFLAPLLYSFARKISDNPWFAILLALAICLGTPIYFYSTIFFSHTIAGVLLFASFSLWFSMRKQQQLNPLKVCVSGFFLAYAFITEYPTALIALVLGIYILYVMREQGALLDFKIYIPLILGAFIPVIIALAYNNAVFHNPFKTGYSYEVVSAFVEGHETGFMGIGWPNLTILFYMTFHTTMGIFWQSPILVLAFVGWVAMWLKPAYRAEALFSFGAVLLYFVVMSGYYIWWGGGAFTPRNIIPVLPFFIIPLAFLPTKSRLVAFILASLSIAQMFLVSSASYQGLSEILEKFSTGPFFSMFQNSIVYNVFFQNFMKQMLVLNRGQEFFHLSGYVGLMPLLLLEMFLLALFFKTTWPGQHNITNNETDILG